MKRSLFVRRTYGFGGAEIILLDWLKRIDYTQCEVFVSSPTMSNIPGPHEVIKAVPSVFDELGIGPAKSMREPVRRSDVAAIEEAAR